MVRRSSAATLAAFGVPESAFDELDLSRLQRSLPDSESKNVISAKVGDFYVYPIVAGLYRLESVKEGKTSNEYVLNMTGTPACSCPDFLYRCASSGIKCKHLWRVLLLVRLGALPAPSQSPYAWLINEIYKDRDWLENLSRDTTDEEAELTKLEMDLTTTDKTMIDYKEAFNTRAQIMLRQSTPTSPDI